LDDISTSSLILVETSPLISFLNIDRFNLLGVLKTPLACTDFVRAEVLQSQKKLNETWASGFLSEVPVETPQHLLEVEKLYERGLGRGEASSIVIAQAEGYDLLIDDKQAKKIATARGVKIISTAEIIMLNIQLGNIMLKEVDGFIEQWKAISEFPISAKNFVD
jgi:predicted nucleic acid-binding protein